LDGIISHPLDATDSDKELPLPLLLLEAPSSLRLWAPTAAPPLDTPEGGTGNVSVAGGTPSNEDEGDSNNDDSGGGEVASAPDAAAAPPPEGPTQQSLP